MCNLPPSVSDNDPSAPWNQKAEYCDDCGSEIWNDEGIKRHVETGMVECIDDSDL